MLREPACDSVQVPGPGSESLPIPLRRTSDLNLSGRNFAKAWPGEGASPRSGLFRLLASPQASPIRIPQVTEDFLLSSPVDQVGGEVRPLPSPKPGWLRVRPPLGPEVSAMKARLRRHGLATVCEEASCPNLGTCFREGVATVMVLGRICTRACPFCEVDHGRPAPPDPDEPERLAAMAVETGIRYLVVTSVDRDDLPDGGAGHFAEVVTALRRRLPALGIEILVPDFRHCLERALPVLGTIVPSVFNHNLETVPRLYGKVRPGADYRHSLALLSGFARTSPGIPVKSGIMVGIGERREEIGEVLDDMRRAGVTLVTVGQYLPPSVRHLPVDRYLDPSEFAEIGEMAKGLGFHAVESAPLVRSSYHAERLLVPEQSDRLGDDRLTFRENSI